jgi:hypothetical protein
VWSLVTGGCQCNRRTAADLERSPLTVEHLEATRIPKAAALVRPAVKGEAVKV